MKALAGGKFYGGARHRAWLERDQHGPRSRSRRCVEALSAGSETAARGCRLSAEQSDVPMSRSNPINPSVFALFGGKLFTSRKDGDMKLQLSVLASAVKEIALRAEIDNQPFVR